MRLLFATDRSQDSRAEWIELHWEKEKKSVYFIIIIYYFVVLCYQYSATSAADLSSRLCAGQETRVAFRLRLIGSGGNSKNHTTRHGAHYGRDGGSQSG